MIYDKGSPLIGFETLKGRVIVGSKVKLREKKLSDARNDYAWQSDPELSRLDAAPVISVSFPMYLLDYADHLHNPKSKRYPLAVETFDGEHIGNCTFYEINESKGEAQLGIMIGDRNFWDKGYGADAIITLTSYVFLNTNLGRIYLKTLDWNLRAQRCFKNSGFTPCGNLNRNGQSFLIMELKREQWAKQHDWGEVKS